MSESTTEALIGAAVLAVAIGFGVFAARGAGIAAGGDSYELTASFRSVEGIRVGTDVRLAGVKVGTVTALDLNPETFFADATLSIRSDVRLPEDSTVLVSAEGLLGGAFVELSPGGSPDTIPPGGEVLDTQGAVSVISLLMKFVGGDGDGAEAAGGAPPP
jgi:phospholipid/cholesterol/gamma-HCH transport system substrate-binding protein